MKKHPITWISIAAGVVLLVCLFVAAFNSGLRYHTLYAEAISYQDVELTSAIREKMERANLLAIMHSIGSIIPVFLLWYIVCAFVIIRRMRGVGMNRSGERYCFPLLIFVASLWWADNLLDSRPAVFVYDEYMNCMLSALGVECCGALIAALAIFFCCYLPWRKRLSHRMQENGTAVEPDWKRKIMRAINMIELIVLILQVILFVMKVTR